MHADTQFLGSRSDRNRGFAVVAELDTPASTLLSGIQYNYPRWGGSQAAITRFCEEWAPSVPDISVEECLANAEYDHGFEDPAKLQAAIDILSKGSIDHFLEQHIAALAREGRMEEAYALAKSRGFMTITLAYAFANGLHNFRIVEEFIAANLAFDPLNPTDLASYAGIRAGIGDFAGARDAIEQAMTYGRYSRTVRAQRIALMRRDPERRFRVLDELVDALDATDGDMELLGSEMLGLMEPSDYLAHRADGSVRPDFECTRLKLFEMHEAQCEVGSRHYSCEPGMTVRRDTQIIEARATRACSEAAPRTGQDIVRYLLDLTEGK